MRFFFPRKAIQYLFFEMWPSLILGLAVFIFIMLMFQAIRYTEFVLIHGVGIGVALQLIGYLSISFLPALFPMSLLFSILMTYGRLSQDSEIVALKAAGHSMWSILTPAVLLGLLIALLSAQTSFHVAPWGNRQFELLITKLGQTKAGATLREGTFSEGFFDLVVYAHEVQSREGKLSKVFIFDERDGDVPLTIIAHQGQLIQDAQNPGRSVYLRLLDGDIHRKAETHTKIKFNSFDLRLVDSFQEEVRAKSTPSLTIEEIQEKLNHAKDLSIDDQRTLTTEFHKRWAVSVACLIFALIGVGLGVNPNARQQRSSLGLCLGVIILYWILYISGEGIARAGQTPPALAIWTPNFIFLGISFWSLRRNWD